MQTAIIQSLSWHIQVGICHFCILNMYTLLPVTVVEGKFEWNPRLYMLCSCCLSHAVLPLSLESIPSFLAVITALDLWSTASCKDCQN